MRHVGVMRRMRGPRMSRFREGNGGQTKDYQKVKALL
jgi:hypothetical protein